MGPMATTNTLHGATSWTKLDQGLRRRDEARWLSSRYAALPQRNSLIALYSFNYELARIRQVVSDPGIAAIRFQWWRESLEDPDQGGARHHDVVAALRDVLVRDQIQTKGLLALIDGYEVAWVEGDRRLEPEAHLARLAARIFVSAHGWGEDLMALAPHWAGLRRGEALGFGPTVNTVPVGIRPAVAHFRLRRLLSRGDAGGPMRRRFCILQAMLSGKV